MSHFMNSNKDGDKTQHWPNCLRTMHRDSNSNLKLSEQLLQFSILQFQTLNCRLRKVTWLLSKFIVNSFGDLNKKCSEQFSFEHRRKDRLVASSGLCLNDQKSYGQYIHKLFSFQAKTIVMRLRKWKAKSFCALILNSEVPAELEFAKTLGLGPYIF